jgi:hypothetical protein
MHEAVITLHDAVPGDEGAIVFLRAIAIAGNTVLVPVGIPNGQQQLVAYTAP